MFEHQKVELYGKAKSPTFSSPCSSGILCQQKALNQENKTFIISRDLFDRFI
jgi:hypothetical protein